MEDECANVINFADGELEADAAQAFRIHLVSCEPCRINLVDAIQLSARLSELRACSIVIASVP